MQVVSQQLLDTLEQSVSLEMSARVFAEWELNSFFDATVTGPESTNPELFPLDSIAEPRRPVRAGLPKNILNQSRIRQQQSSGTKYRMPSPDSNYKYFHSLEQTGASAPYEFSESQTFTVEYAESVPCNMIVIGFETSFAAPTTTSVFAKISGAWESLGVYNVDADGRIDLYLQSDDSWSTTESRDDVADIDGVRVSVSEMDTPNAGVSVIQVSPRLSLDLSDRVVDVSIDRAREEFERTNPIGTASSASANIRFDNSDRFFNQTNTSSPVHKILENNVKFEIFDVVLRNDDVFEAVPQGVFFADSWRVGSGIDANLQATDRTKFLQETMIENSTYTGLSAEYIVPDIIERFGHNLYDMRYVSADLGKTIPHVFFRNDQTVWEALTSLALAEQAAFYFDEQDRFVWESRDYVYGNNSPAFTLRENLDGSNLPNLVSFDQQYQLSANRVNVSYVPLKPATAQGKVVNNVVWEESEETVLQSTALKQDLLASGDTIVVSDEDWEFFPESGFVNIDGEYIGFEKSTTTGQLDVTERGMFDSAISNHYLDPINNFWSFFSLHRTSSNWSKRTTNTTYGRHVLRDSFVELEVGRTSFTIAHYMGGSLGDRFAAYGTEMVFPVSKDWEGEPYYEGQGVGGMFLHHNGVDDGYYFEVLTNKIAYSVDPPKAQVRVFKIQPGGGYKWVTSTVQKDGVGAFDVIPGRRHRLEILYNNDTKRFDVYVDGSPVLNFTDGTSGTKRTSGKWGVWARTDSVIRFEHAWAFNRSNRYTDLPIVMDTFIDRVLGGFNSGLLESQWKQYNRRYRDLVFEDFGPWVQQGIEYEVDYEIAPNTVTDLFVSNDQDVYEMFHKRDPFSSHFAIVSRARGPAVVVGSDPSRDDQSMSLFVYGQPIIEQGAESVHREDKLSIKRRGVDEFELESPWIQTKARAERIADWLIERWGKTNDIVQVETIVYPPLQVGDLVAVESPSDSMSTETHQYHIVGISKSVGSKFGMDLTLRRKR